VHKRAGQLSRYSNWLRAGQSENRIPVGARFSARSDRPWGQPSLLYNGYRVFPGVKSGRGLMLTPHPLLVPWSRKSTATPLLPLWSVQPVQSLSACTRVHFTFTLPCIKINNKQLLNEYIYLSINTANF